MKQFEKKYYYKNEKGFTSVQLISDIAGEILLCTCGFRGKTKELSCPKCGSEVIYKKTLHFRSLNINTSICIVKEAIFTNEKAYIRLGYINIELQLSLKSGTNFDSELKDGEITINTEKDFIIDIGYKINKKNKKVIDATFTNEGITKKFIKKDLNNIHIEITNAHSLLIEMAMENYYNTNSLIWSINNRYKFLSSCLTEELLKIKGEKNQLLKMQELYLNDELRPYLMKSVNKFNTSYINDIINPYTNKESDEWYKKYVNKRSIVEDTILDDANNYSKQYLTRLTMILDYSKEDLEKFIALANRQHYHIKFYNKYSLDIVEYLVKNDLPVLKNMKELHIFFNKIQKTYQMLSNTTLNWEPKKLLSHLSNDIDVNEITFCNDYKLINIAYEMKNNYSILDKILSIRFMDGLIPVYLKVNDECYKDAIFFYKVSNNKEKEIMKILLKDTIISNTEEINKFINELKIDKIIGVTEC